MQSNKEVVQHCCDLTKTRAKIKMHFKSLKMLAKTKLKYQYIISRHDALQSYRMHTAIVLC